MIHKPGRPIYRMMAPQSRSFGYSSLALCGDAASSPAHQRHGRMMTLSASATQAPLSYPRHVPVWRGVLCAFCASLIGIGLARFAYSPLLPAIVGAHWFQPATAAYLGAANLTGYLAGALLGRPISAHVRVVTVLRASMALATLAFFACASHVSFEWFFVWRFASGLAGGMLMVLAAPTVLPGVSASRRGLAGGVHLHGGRGRHCRLGHTGAGSAATRRQCGLGRSGRAVAPPHGRWMERMAFRHAGDCARAPTLARLACRRCARSILCMPLTGSAGCRT